MRMLGRRSLVCGGSFAALQFLTSNFHGADAGRRGWRSGVAGRAGRVPAVLAAGQDLAISPMRRDRAESSKPTASDARGKSIYAWTPWVLLSVMVFLWGWPAMQDRPERRTGGAAECSGRRQQVLVRGAGAARRGVSHRAGRARCQRGRSRREAGEGRLRFQLAVGHRHGHFSGGDPVRPSGCALRPQMFVRQFSRRCGGCGWRC